MDQSVGHLGSQERELPATPCQLSQRTAGETSIKALPTTISFKSLTQLHREFENNKRFEHVDFKTLNNHTKINVF